MSGDILNSIILASSFFTLFGVAEVLYHFLKVKVELTRKFVHIGTGFLSLLFPLMLGSHWPVLFLCAGFGVILILSLKFNLLKSINAIDRESMGSLCYPVSVYFCYVAYEHYNHIYVFFYLPILILAISDPIAALTGKKWPLGKYKINKDNKTLMGSSMFFLSSFLICIIYFGYARKDNTSSPFEYSFIFICSLIIGIVSSIAEAFSRRGYDNLTVPASVLFVMISAVEIFTFIIKE